MGAYHTANVPIKLDSAFNEVTAGFFEFFIVFHGLGMTKEDGISIVNAFLLYHLLQLGIHFFIASGFAQHEHLPIQNPHQRADIQHSPQRRRCAGKSASFFQIFQCFDTSADAHTAGETFHLCHDFCRRFAFFGSLGSDFHQKPQREACGAGIQNVDFLPFHGVFGDISRLHCTAQFRRNQQAHHFVRFFQRRRKHFLKSMGCGLCCGGERFFRPQFFVKFRFTQIHAIQIDVIADVHRQRHTSDTNFLHAFLCQVAGAVCNDFYHGDFPPHLYTKPVFYTIQKYI